MVQHLPGFSLEVFLGEKFGPTSGHKGMAKNPGPGAYDHEPPEKPICQRLPGGRLLFFGAHILNKQTYCIKHMDSRTSKGQKWQKFD